MPGRRGFAVVCDVSTALTNLTTLETFAVPFPLLQTPSLEQTALVSLGSHEATVRSLLPPELRAVTLKLALSYAFTSPDDGCWGLFRSQKQNRNAYRNEIWTDNITKATPGSPP